MPYFIRDVSALYIAAAMCGLSLAFFNVIVQNLVGIHDGRGRRIEPPAKSQIKPPNTITAPRTGSHPLLLFAGRSFFSRHFCAFTSSFRKSDRDGLFPACDLLAGASALQRSLLAFMHRPLDFRRRLLAVLCHRLSSIDTGPAGRVANPQNVVVSLILAACRKGPTGGKAPRVALLGYLRANQASADNQPSQMHTQLHLRSPGVSTGGIRFSKGMAWTAPRFT